MAASTLSHAAPSLSDILSTTANLSSLNDLLTNQMPDLLKLLEGYDSNTNPVTLLAPSDDAFMRIPYTDVLGQAFSDNDTAQIKNFMLYHIVPGLHSSETLNKNGSFQYLPTMLTSNNWTNVTGGQRVGAVLQGNDPPIVVFTSGLSTRSVVSQQDIEFKGGILQVIDAFVVPPMPYVYTADQYNLAYAEYSVLSFTGALYSQPSNLSLATTLNTTSDLTFFIPSNIAMELVSGTLASMSPSALQNILSYHIVPGRHHFETIGPMYSSNFTNGTQVPTLQGTNVTLDYTWNAYFVNSARITASDILIANGVMHVIDNVLTPDKNATQPNPTTYTQMPVLPTTMADGEQFNSSAAPFTTFMPNIVSTASADANATSDGSGAGGFGAAATATGSSSSNNRSTSNGKTSGAESSRQTAHAGGVGGSREKVDECYIEAGIAPLVALQESFRKTKRPAMATIDTLENTAGPERVRVNAVPDDSADEGIINDDGVIPVHGGSVLLQPGPNIYEWGVGSSCEVANGIRRARICMMKVLVQ
ncbi:hypothetical protein B0A55_08410 [Friedmanniomyces simplex]|uniref:FAS1 domain-containing protein n=1 Tax=Friedmanniomyces simplex TaxID=329884 RepID=A0A4V5NGY6_9PEZI|nr:hypothetical protein B0A55_08410 [Friedmanniomyces simplex]